MGFVVSIGSTLLLLLSLQRSRFSTLLTDRALCLLTTRASAAAITLPDDNALALCRLCARRARLRLKTRVFGIRQVWKSDQQPRYEHRDNGLSYLMPPSLVNRSSITAAKKVH